MPRLGCGGWAMGATTPYERRAGSLGKRHVAVCDGSGSTRRKHRWRPVAQTPATRPRVGTGRPGPGIPASTNMPPGASSSVAWLTCKAGRLLKYSSGDGVSPSGRQAGRTRTAAFGSGHW